MHFTRDLSLVQNSSSALLFHFYISTVLYGFPASVDMISQQRLRIEIVFFIIKTGYIIGSLRNNLLKALKYSTIAAPISISITYKVLFSFHFIQLLLKTSHNILRLHIMHARLHRSKSYTRQQCKHFNNITSTNDHVMPKPASENVFY